VAKAKTTGASEAAKGRRPKRANGEGGARQRANGSWEWRVTLEDGRRFSGYGKTQAEAKRSCLGKAGLAKKGVDPKAARQTVGAFLEWWLADVVAAKCQPKTLKTYDMVARLHLVPALGRLEMAKLSPQHVQSLLREKEQAGLSPRSVAMIREVLRGALNVAVRLQVVERNAAILAQPRRQERSGRATFSPEQARAFLAATEADRLAALWRLALTLGLRRGELLGLRWADVDLDAGTLRVERSLQRVDGRLVTKAPKTARSRRTLAVPSSLAAALQAHRDRQAFEAEEAAGKGRRWEDSGFVFVTPVGTPIDPDNLSKRYKALLKAAGLRDQRFHDLRHAAATLLIAEGLPINLVSEMLGHAQTSTTINVYSHALPLAQRHAAEAMERLLG